RIARAVSPRRGSRGSCRPQVYRSCREFDYAFEDRCADHQFGASMKILLFSALFSVTGTWAWAQIESPQIGVMLDVSGRARPVSGAPAAAVAGTPWFDGTVI